MDFANRPYAQPPEPVDKRTEVIDMIKEWAKELHPCEPPCDSLGICVECHKVYLILAGANKALSLLGYERK